MNARMKISPSSESFCIIAVRLSRQAEEAKVIRIFFFSSWRIQEFFQGSCAEQVDLDELEKLLDG
jgi:hypothetical protein